MWSLCAFRSTFWSLLCAFWLTLDFYFFLVMPFSFQKKNSCDIVWALFFQPIGVCLLLFPFNRKMNPYEEVDILHHSPRSGVNRANPPTNSTHFERIRVTVAAASGTTAGSEAEAEASAGPTCVCHSRGGALLHCLPPESPYFFCSKERPYFFY